MLTEKPPVGETLVFVKLFEGRPWYTTFCLHWDNSCGFDYPLDESPAPNPPRRQPVAGEMQFGQIQSGGVMHAKFYRRTNAWRRAFEKLAELGFLPLAEA